MSHIAIIGALTTSQDEDSGMILSPFTSDAGEALWALAAERTGATYTDFMRAFHRYALCVGFWDVTIAEENWQSMEEQLIARFEKIILVGRNVSDAVGLVVDDIYISDTLICIPDPLVQSYWYHVKGQKACVQILFEELYREALSKV